MGRFIEKTLLYVGIVCASAALGLMPSAYASGGYLPTNCTAGGTPPDDCTCSGACNLIVVSIACTGHVIHIPVLGPKCACGCL